jgi:hypothetical protein
MTRAARASKPLAHEGPPSISGRPLAPFAFGYRKQSSRVADCSEQRQELAPAGRDGASSTIRAKVRVTVVSAVHCSESKRPPRDPSIAPFGRSWCSPISTLKLNSGLPPTTKKPGRGEPVSELNFQASWKPRWYQLRAVCLLEDGGRVLFRECIAYLRPLPFLGPLFWAARVYLHCAHSVGVQSQGRRRLHPHHLLHGIKTKLRPRARVLLSTQSPYAVLP